jgi:hypothetical protein
MRIAAMGLLLVPGCVFAHEGTPGYPELFVKPERAWIVGEENRAWAYWKYGCEEPGDDWGCPSSTATLLDVTCDGCQVIGNPLGTSGRGGVMFSAVATTDQAIKITAKLRFDPTGDTATVSSFALTGDREVAIEATCKAIDTATLAQRDLRNPVPQELFHGGCDAKRLASDTLVVFPALRTLHGDARFPFCATPTVCGGFDGDHLRPADTFSIAPAPINWARSDQIEPAEFAILPAMPDGGTVSLSVQLAPSGTATTSVEIPPLQ